MIFWRIVDNKLYSVNEVDELGFEAFNFKKLAKRMNSEFIDLSSNTLHPIILYNISNIDL